jgi:GTPase SAR1 family protein
MAKIVIVGDEGVGKTELLCSVMERRFDPEIETQNPKIHQIFVKEGAHEFTEFHEKDVKNPLAKKYFDGATTVCLCCDLSQKDFKTHVGKLAQWINSIRKHNSTVPIIIIGTKADAITQDKLTKRRAQLKEKALTLKVAGPHLINTKDIKNYDCQNLFMDMRLDFLVAQTKPSLIKHLSILFWNHIKLNPNVVAVGIVLATAGILIFSVPILGQLTGAAFLITGLTYWIGSSIAAHAILAIGAGALGLIAQIEEKNATQVSTCFTGG